MNKLAKLVVAASILSASFSAQAQTEVSLNDRIAGLPFLKDAKVKINAGPSFAAVQTTAYISFKFSSCRGFNFEVKKEEAAVAMQKTTLVALVIPANQSECRGLPVERDYRIQISSDVLLDGQYVLVNPTNISQQVINPPAPINNPICTAIAGVTINEETGECRSFSNGCTLASLQDQGFRFAGPEECN